MEEKIFFEQMEEKIKDVNQNYIGYKKNTFCPKMILVPSVEKCV
jgi:hypothetical protein